MMLQIRKLSIIMDKTGEKHMSLDQYFIVHAL